MEIVAKGLEETKQFACALVGKLAPQTDRATVIALSGDLGSGKTTLTQYIAEAFGVEERVTSPTYVIEKVYELLARPFERLVHIDAYRLTGEHELATLGWDALLKDSKTIILIEWPEKVAGLVPADAIRITLEGSGETRTIHYDGKDI